MSNLITQNRIFVEDIKDPKMGFDLITRSFNKLVQDILNTFNQNLNFGDNIDSNIKKLSFKTMSTYNLGDWIPIKFPCGTKGKPFAVLLGQIIENPNEAYTAIETGVTISWMEINREININFVSGLKNSTQYNITFLVL